MIKPISDWVMIERPKSPNIIGSIHLPTQTGRTKPEYGTVVACGRGRRTTDGERIPMQVGVGDTVLFRRFDVEKIKGIEALNDKNGQPYIFIRDRDLWGVIENYNGEKITARTVSEK